MKEGILRYLLTGGMVMLLLLAFSQPAGHAGEPPVDRADTRPGRG